MTTAPDPDPAHATAAPPLRVDPGDAAGRLLAALLAAGGLTQQVREAALAETR
jgi:hypothetical protein